MKYLDPKADLTFKKIFGNHPDRLKTLLNTLQSLNEDELIQQQQYLPTTEELEISGFTDAELRAYDKFWDSVSVERTLLDDRYQKGMEEGMEKAWRKVELKASMRPTQKQHNVCWQWDFLPNRLPKLPRYLLKSLRI